jgi:hypothetical protein
MFRGTQNRFSLTCVAVSTSGYTKGGLLSVAGHSCGLASTTPVHQCQCRPSRLTTAGCAAAITLAVLWITSTNAQNLFVSNLYSKSIWEFDLGGNLITASLGSGLGDPQGIAFDRSGNLYMAYYDYGVRRGSVAKLGPSGALISASFISGLGYPTGLAFDSGGNLYVANTDYGRIAKYSPTGNLLNATFATGLSSAWAMAFDKDDNLYVTDSSNNKVVKIGQSGSMNASFITGLGYPTGLCFDRSGDLCVANYYTGIISKYDTTGHLLNASFAVTGQGYNVESLAIDLGGNLYVGNNGNGVVMKFGPDGNLINASFASGGAGAEYIAFPLVVPEPSCWMVAGLGLSTVLVVKRRKRSNQDGVSEGKSSD